MAVHGVSEMTSTIRGFLVCVAMFASPCLSASESCNIRLTLDNGHLSIPAPGSITGGVNGSIRFVFNRFDGIQTLDAFPKGAVPDLPSDWKEMRRSVEPFPYVLYVARLKRGTEAYRLIVGESDWRYWFSFHKEEVFTSIIESYSHSGERDQDCQ